jgi:hypothetical protein
MNLNNAYKVYCCLYRKYYPGRDPMKLKDCINNLTHSLPQQDPEMRQRGIGAPPSATKNLESTSSGEGKIIWYTAKQQPFASPTAAHGTGAVRAGTPNTPINSLTSRGAYYQQAAYSRMKNEQPGRNHISVPMIISGSGRCCQWDKCPGLKINNKIKRAYISTYQCEQCTNEKGYDIWFCHSTKKVDDIDIVVDCHTRYHVEKKLFSVQHTGSATKSAVDSELTEE